ncbi:hypothetical protein FBY21_0414 [Pseudomonas sp. SLBN-26]|uniref:hypothetical protein n=1 Tax=Pseudomonadaceae TaxID=135621 RepID=UPI00115335E2|nr:MULTISPECIES: hypothetical protein [Pseudomonas]MCP1615806.1 hypothetical protein [Pseudomonas otitidis]TQL05074.1 hypothetical protein FBY21_0414 [Pseudomonas sp. SLBN-26]
MSVRISALKLMASEADFNDGFGIVAAFVHCLEPGEVAELLRSEAGKSSKLRNSLLRKAVHDAEGEFLPAHQRLVEFLIEELAVSDGKSRQGIGFTLSSLLPVLTVELKQKIYLTFLQSRYVGLRRRAYKAMTHETEPMLDSLLDAWRNFRDWECSWLLVKILPPEDLLSLKNEILPLLSERWMISRLYIRIACVEPAAVMELAEIDGISYCYVLAKLGRAIPGADAKELIKKYQADERFGLLVWCVGQMGLWDVLVWLKGYLPHIEKSQTSALNVHSSSESCLDKKVEICPSTLNVIF